MAADLEPVAAALMDRVSSLADVAYVTRMRVGLDSLPSEPAVIVAMSGGDFRPSHGLPTRVTANFEVGYVARVDGSEESPESRLNAWLVELQGAMEPGEGERANTLGETCEHAWLSGSFEVVPPTRDTPWMECWATVEVLVVG